MREISTELIMAMNPLIEQSTNIYNTEKYMPNLDETQIDPHIKEAKKKCLHWIRDNQGQLTFDLRPVEGEKDVYICQACGHRLNLKFDDAGVGHIIDAIRVIDGLVFMGPQHNMPASELMPLVNIKEALYRVATIQKAFNLYVKKQESVNSATTSLTAGYETPERYTSITGYTN